MQLFYRQCVDKRGRAALFRQMEAEGLLPFAMSARAKPTLRDWLALTEQGAARRDGVALLRCEDAAGEILGCGLFTRQPYRVWHFDFTAFRAGFSVAAEQARGGFRWVFEHLDCTSIMGVCPLPNRHAWKLAGSCGFRVLARLPEACFYARKGKYVDGILVFCTADDLDAPGKNKNHKEVHMGFGGGGTPGIPTPAPVPKAETTKDVTAASTEARQSQKDKAAKAAGLKNTILSDALTADTAAAGTKKTLLGQ